jgi:adenylosuccinate lyase
MPQKRNPERSEHLSTLAAVVRSAAGLALDAMVGEHERDGAAWKTEWALLPQACGAAGVALALGAELTAGLRVDEQRMRENVEAQRGYVLAEPAMVALGAEIGPRRAHELVHAAAARGTIEGLTLNTVLRDDSVIGRHLSAERLDDLLRPEAALGSADELVRRVLGD